MKKLVAFLAVTTLSVTAAAQAAVIDFVAEAAGNERGVADGTTINFNGVNVTFSSLNSDRYFAYFDDLSDAGGFGGLGVCSELETGPGSECAVPSDDNIHNDQSVTLTFDSAHTLSSHSFTDADHNDLNGNNTNTLLIAINDPDDFQRYTFAEAVALVIAGTELIRYAFDPSETGLAFYVNSFEAVSDLVNTPLPGAAPLLFAGLGGLLLAGRKKRRSAG